MQKSLVNIVLALGGNIGDVRLTILLAFESLKCTGLVDAKISPFYVSKAVDCIPETPDFVNAVIVGAWNNSIDELFRTTQALEIAAGRPQKHRSDVSRTLDIDIILFGDAVISSEKLIIPHPRARERDFVMVPLNAVAPDLVFPDTNKSVSETLKEL